MRTTKRPVGRPRTKRAYKRRAISEQTAINSQKEIEALTYFLSASTNLDDIGKVKVYKTYLNSIK